MISFIFFACVLFFRPPLLYYASAENNMSMPICPQNFSCPNLIPFKYPFYNSTENQCGLIKVRCNSKGGNITLGGHSYVIAGKFDYDSSVIIHNTTFENLVKTRDCEALMNNFTSPSPLLYSISIAPFITVFKCTNNHSYAQQLEVYFNQSNYNMHYGCKDHKFYYKYSFNNATVPSDLPHGCMVIQLPAKSRWGEGPKETDIFAPLSSAYTISFKLSPPCEKCNKEGGHCHTNNGHHECSNARKVVAGQRKLSRIILVSVCAGAVATSLIIILCLKRKIGWRKMEYYNVNVELFLRDQKLQLAPKRFSYSQVKKMTNSFKVKLGQGGFGTVYKGVLRNQNEVAVKVLSELKGNGEELINEVASVGRTSHVNIVSLVGFCIEGRRRALIYEFMPNGSLERFIYGRGSSSIAQLGWEKLYQIAIGIARGLEYLHRDCNTRILHFDIKPHNILLDTDFCPKISDFGLAKLFHGKESKISMSNMRGTPGYIAPELFSRSFGDVSHKSDVYSYGMMILEMVGGRRNIEAGVDHTSEIYFPHWIYKKVELHEQLGLHEIMSDEENRTARKMIIVGLWCIQTNPVSRPTITKVLEMLEGDLELLEIPPKPYLCSPSRSLPLPSIDTLHPYGSSTDTL